jgi:hypothetical protein
MSNLVEPKAGRVVERSYISKSGDKKHIFAPVYNQNVGDADNLIEGQKYYYEYRLRNEEICDFGMFWFATERTLVFFREDEPTLTLGIPIANIKYLVPVKGTEK